MDAAERREMEEDAAERCAVSLEYNLRLYRNGEPTRLRAGDRLRGDYQSGLFSIWGMQLLRFGGNTLETGLLDNKRPLLGILPGHRAEERQVAARIAKTEFLYFAELLGALRQLRAEEAEFQENAVLVDFKDGPLVCGLCQQDGCLTGLQSEDQLTCVWPDGTFMLQRQSKPLGFRSVIDGKGVEVGKFRLPGHQLAAPSGMPGKMRFACSPAENAVEFINSLGALCGLRAEAVNFKASSLRVVFKAWTPDES